MVSILELAPKVKALRSIELHIGLLRFFGFHPLDQRGWSAAALNLHRVWSLFMVLSCYSYYMLEFRYVIEHLDDIGEVVNASALFLTHLVSILKQYVLRFKAKRIIQLIDAIDGKIFNEGFKAHNLILQSMSTTARAVLIFYTSCAAATCLLWAIFPLLEKSTERKLPLKSTFPFDTVRTPGFEIAFFIQNAVVMTIALVNTTSDAVVSTLMANAHAQFQILCYNIENIVEISIEKTLATFERGGNDMHLQPTREMFDRIAEKELIKCLRHHKSITDFVEEVEYLFNFSILGQFTASGTIICAIAYRMTEVYPLTLEFLSMGLFMTCIVVEIFLYCYYGNELNIQSAHLTQAIYNSQWLSTNVSHRKSMLIFMERSKRPIKLTAGKLFTLNLDTFIGIIKSSYTFFAVLKGTK